MSNQTTRRNFLKISGAGIGAALAAKGTAAEVESKPLTLPLECAGKDCSLLRGKPQTSGMRSGFVRLKPGETIGWHSTGKYEETLVILNGQGEALIKGQKGMPFAAPHLVYYPPATEHNIHNTGQQMLEYVYVVAPAGS